MGTRNGLRRGYRDLQPLYGRIKELYEAGYSYSEGAKELKIPVGSFAGSIGRMRAKGIEINKRPREIDHRHYVVEKKPTLPRLKFMEEK